MVSLRELGVRFAGSPALSAAPSFAEVQKQVAALIKDRILIGHAISNDTTVRLRRSPHPR